MLNTILGIVVLVVLVCWVAFAFRKRKEDSDLEDLKYTLDDITEFVKVYVKTELALRFKKTKTVDIDEFRRDKSRKELQKALRTCMHGNISNKMLVKSFLKTGIVTAYEFTDETLERVVPFSNPKLLDYGTKFHIILYKRMQIMEDLGLNKYDAFSEIIKSYNLDRLRENPYSQTEVDRDGQERKREQAFIILDSDIEEIYEKENVELTLDDKINIIVQKVYSKYKGLGIIDEIIDQNLDGVRGGTGGLPADLQTFMDIDNKDFYGKVHRDYDHVKIFYKGKSMHLDFLSFGSELELSRICNIIYTYAPVGQLNKRNGHKISEREDKSRVVVTSPNLTDSYTFFVRKFDGGLVDIASLFKNKKGGEMIIRWLRLTARGAITTAFTGQQGTGKTTLMRAAVAFFPGYWNIRVQEGSAFELWLRKAFPWKDIVTFKETDTVSGEEGLYIQKKTDGTVNLVGEAAEDKVISWIMKTANVASLFTWFTHHANTAKSLIDACRDALFNCGFAANELSAEIYVSRTLKANFHLVNVIGDRYMERYTEIIPLEEEDYPVDYKVALNPIDAFLKFLDNVNEFFKRSTSRKVYRTEDLFIHRNGEYVANKRPSNELIAHMKSNMLEEDQADLDDFLETYFGRRSNAA